jgi:hypothetical protein
MVEKNLFKCNDCGIMLSEPPEIVETQRQILDPPDAAQEGHSAQLCQECNGLDSFEEVEITDVIPAFFERCDNPCDMDCQGCVQKAIEIYNNDLDSQN